MQGLDRNRFCKMYQGKQVDLFTLRNSRGCEVAITNYGGAIMAINVPDRNGVIDNVIQGHGCLEDCIESAEPFLSTLVGRYANRICRGRFTLDGVTYQLAVNNGPNHLHGGPTGFHARVWDVVSASSDKLVLRYVSEDGEEGFPGQLTVEVTYTWTEDNELFIEYEARSDRKTIVNLTSHGFFSLQGVSRLKEDEFGNNALQQILEINADYYLPIDETSIPVSGGVPVEKTPFDFRKPKVVGLEIEAEDEQIRNGAGYDHCFVLNKTYQGECSLAARLYEPVSGRVMEVRTTEPGLQFYSDNWACDIKGPEGVRFQKHSALCFEAQHYPDSPNHEEFPSVVLCPGEIYRQKTSYKFL